MSELVVSHRSATARWGERGLARRLGGPCEAPADWAPPSARALDDAALRRARLEATAGRPLHVLVRDQLDRPRSRRLVGHVWSGPLPDDALFRLAPGILICSPGFCLQQLCAGASVPRAVAAAMEVCGGYALSAAAPRGFHERPPLETPEALARRFAHEHGYGARRVREALELAVPGSRSPMETVVALFFTLPVELGGCGLPAPLLNVRIEIPGDLAAALGRPYLVADMCWPDRRVILEYDSYIWHLPPAAFDGTQSRNEGLRDEGWMVRSVTSGILADDRLRRLLVSRVLRRFGRPMPDDEGFDLRQRALVRDLLGIRGA